MSNPSVLTAIERAKQIAAKLSQQNPTPEKRSADSDGEPSSKKFANINDVVGAQLAAFKAQNIVTEEYRVPDKIVGLVIGKGGEQIQKLQNEAGCKIVVQSESIGQTHRICTISGSRESVDRAKKLIDEIVLRGATDSSMLPPGHEMQEMRIAANKCGLIIGKNGETIKRLGDQYGVKLVVVQEQINAAGEKPLRISGEAERVRSCKEEVLRLIAPKNDRHERNEYGSRTGVVNANGQTESYVRVPSDKAGIVIGKGGETIKDINRRTGAQCEIDKQFRNTDGPDKFFIIRGTYDQIIYAQQLIYEKISGNVGGTPPTGYFGPNALQPQPGYTGSPNDSSSAQGAYGAWGYPTSPSGNGTMDQMAAWAAYYQQYYQQAGATAAQPAAAAPGGAQPSVNPQTGQPDYSLAWVDYYRSLGMHAEADAILKQTQNGTAATTTSTTSPSSTATSTTTPTTTTASSSSASASSSSNAAAAAAAAWQNYAYAGYAGYPGYGTTQNQ